MEKFKIPIILTLLVVTVFVIFSLMEGQKETTDYTVDNQPEITNPYPNKSYQELLSKHDKFKIDFENKIDQSELFSPGEEIVEEYLYEGKYFSLINFYKKNVLYDIIADCISDNSMKIIKVDKDYYATSEKNLFKIFLKNDNPENIETYMEMITLENKINTSCGGSDTAIFTKNNYYTTPRKLLSLGDEEFSEYGCDKKINVKTNIEKREEETVFTYYTTSSAFRLTVKKISIHSKNGEFQEKNIEEVAMCGAGIMY